MLMSAGTSAAKSSPDWSWVREVAFVFADEAEPDSPESDGQDPGCLFFESAPRVRDDTGPSLFSFEADADTADFAFDFGFIFGTELTGRRDFFGFALLMTVGVSELDCWVISTIAGPEVVEEPRDDLVRLRKQFRLILLPNVPIHSSGHCKRVVRYTRSVEK